LVVAGLVAAVYFATRGGDSGAAQDSLVAAGVTSTVASTDTQTTTATTGTPATSATSAQPAPTTKPTGTTVKLVGQLIGNLNLQLVSKVTRYEETDTHLSWTGNWISDVDTDASAGGYRVAMSTGANVNLRFQGTGASLFALKGATSGIAKLTLDGQISYVDLYSTSFAWQKVWSSSTLTSGVHELKWEATGLRNANASMSYVSFDAVEITDGTLLTP
jgi:hypothetical protein